MKKKYSKYLIFYILFFSNTCFANTYIFASFSMNDEALKSYYKEAEKYNAVIVMRGLVNDSFIKTRQKITQLKISYDINPELFAKYEINSVPVIVKETEDKVHKVVGHISLKNALDMFSQGG